MHEALSVFDIFKIGVGPSSSHTLGPWRASLDFTKRTAGKPINKLVIRLFGSLSKTGKGHATDKAILLGLLGYDPVTMDTSSIDSIVQNINESKEIPYNGVNISFDPKINIIFNNVIRKDHPNTLLYEAYDESDQLILQQEYHSVGGGFIETPKSELEPAESYSLPFPINRSIDLLSFASQKDTLISDIVWENELVFHDKDTVEKKLHDIYSAMLDSIYRGCTTSGVLPGGLGVKRRAKNLAIQLMDRFDFNSREEWEEIIRNCEPSFSNVNKWVSCFALAVNEENANLGRVVTSPTNGAAGVIPAVLMYYKMFCEKEEKWDHIKRFFLVAGEIGCMFKKGATISAAVGGCQAEIGVSSAMAAGALTEVLGGSPKQVLMAAEIAMEHHLGMTCDPIGGLVQIPCIERNTMGAIKAITASNLALASNPDDAKVNLDVVIKTMWNTAMEMNEKYKETSEGGLAYELPVTIPEC